MIQWDTKPLSVKCLLIIDYINLNSEIVGK